MALTPLPTNINDGGASLELLGAIARELRGLSVNVGAGAGVGVKVAVAPMRSEDQILSVIRTAAGVVTDVTANYSIADTVASGTLTAAAVAAEDVCVVNGVTYTAKVTPTSNVHFKIGADNTATAVNLAATVNAYEKRHDGTRFRTGAVVATSAAAVVTIKAVVDGAAGNAITLTGTAVRLVASGAGTLTNGSDTGGVASNADHSAASTLQIMWYNKQ